MSSLRSRSLPSLFHEVSCKGRGSGVGAARKRGITVFVPTTDEGADVCHAGAVGNTRLLDSNVLKNLHRLLMRRHRVLLSATQLLILLYTQKRQPVNARLSRKFVQLRWTMTRSPLVSQETIQTLFAVLRLCLRESSKTWAGHYSIFVLS